MTNDPLNEAIETVERYLELSMVPDPEGAAQYAAPDFRIVFTGGPASLLRQRARRLMPSVTNG